MEPVLESLQSRSHGEKYVHEDDTAEHALGFAQVRILAVETCCCHSRFCPGQTRGESYRCYRIQLWLP